MSHKLPIPFVAPLSDEYDDHRAKSEGYMARTMKDMLAPQTIHLFTLRYEMIRPSIRRPARK